ncbi:MAG: HU family DNA-binding protein [Acidimicrobiales bacterium]
MPGGPVNRSELVEAVAKSSGLEKRQAEDAVKAITATVIEATKAGEKVTLVGFGSFTPASRAARMGRNPQTGAAVKIAASKGVRFAPGAEYKAALNAKPAARKAAPAKAVAKKSAPAAKAAATKAPATKAPATKAPAKKAPAKKAARSTTKK